MYGTVIRTEAKVNGKSSKSIDIYPTSVVTNYKPGHYPNLLSGYVINHVI